MKKRILEVVGRMDRAGQETFLMNIFKTRNKNKYEFVFSVNGNEIGDYEQEINELGGSIFHNPYNPHDIFKYLKELRLFLKNYGPFDAIHCHTFLYGGFIMWIAYKEKIPVRIMHSHSTNDGKNSNLFRILYRSVMTKLINKYSNVKVACSKEAYKSLFKKEPKDDKYILNNSINIEDFDEKNISKIEEKKKLLLSLKDEIFISVARFAKVKNHNKIIDVFNYYNTNINKKSKLLLVGDGELRSLIEKRVEELNLKEKVLFLGKRNDVNKLLLISDILLMPSLYEGLPVSLVEAQAAGVPCIISDNITDEVDMNLGLIEKVSLELNDEFWAKKCLEMISKDKIIFNKRKKEITKKGFTLDNVWDKLENFYDGKL